MEALSVREYRNNLAASFTKADNGEQVLIRRKNEIYALVKVGREDLMNDLSISEATVTRAFRNFKTNGLIIRQGANKKGYWQITEKGKNVIS